MMHEKFVSIGLLLGATMFGLWGAAEAQESASASAKGAPAGAQVSAEEMAKREAAFSELLSHSRLVGYTTLSSESPDKLIEDTYTLKRVTKAEGNLWSFEAAIEFGGRSVPITMKFPVEWAGDTPVLSVTNQKFPMMGAYSARVLFYGDQYVALWSGSNVGGQMFGRIVKDAEPSSGGADGEQQEEMLQDGEGGNGADSGGSSGSASSSVVDDGTNWPSFRGPRANGVAEGFATVKEWDLESGKNVKWKVMVPGMSHSSPVLWGDQIFVTTAIRAAGEQVVKVGLYGSIEGVPDEGAFAFALYCFDKKTGKELWNRVSWEGLPKYQRHPKGSYAASSPATDGKHVLAFYGQEGLYCYDMQGELLWSRSFGDLDSGYYEVKEAQWGFSSSPILHAGMAIIQCDVQEGSFLMAMDAATGKTLWRTERDENPTWSTPTVVITEGREQVVCNGYKHIGGYDLKTGKELWKLVGGGDIPVPTPILARELIFITNAHGRMAPIYAIDPSAEGTIEMVGDSMAWSERSRGNYMQTPLAYGEDIYFCNDAGILTSFDVGSGELNYRERIGQGNTGFTGSGVAADGKLYFTSEEGDVHVIRAGLDMEQLSINTLGEACLSCPAISEGVIYFRSVGHLIAIGS